MYAAMFSSLAVVLISHNLIRKGLTCYPAPPYRDVEEPVDDNVTVNYCLATYQELGTSLLFAYWGTVLWLLLFAAFLWMRGRSKVKVILNLQYAQHEMLHFISSSSRYAFIFVLRESISSRLR